MMARAFNSSCVLLIFVLASCSQPGSVTVPSKTTKIILRHADRDGDDLSEKGRARAEALVDAVSGMPIDAIYSPGIQRNLDTAAPLAAARGLEITRIPPTNAATRLFSENAGKTFVWVGNKGNLAEIWGAIGAGGQPPIEYGELYFVRKGELGTLIIDRRFFGPE